MGEEKKKPSAFESDGFKILFFLFIVFFICPCLTYCALWINYTYGPEPSPSSREPVKYQGDKQTKYMNAMDDCIRSSPDVKYPSDVGLSYTPGDKALRVTFPYGGKDAMYKEQGVAIGMYAAAVQEGFKGNTMDAIWYTVQNKRNKVIGKFKMTRAEAKSIDLDNPLAIAGFVRKAEQRIT